MRRTLLCISLLCLVAASAGAQVTSQPASASAAASEEDILKAGREDLQRSRADVMAKNMLSLLSQTAFASQIPLVY
jgi:hypothetical protein